MAVSTLSALSTFFLCNRPLWSTTRRCRLQQDCDRLEQARLERNLMDARKLRAQQKRNKLASQRGDRPFETRLAVESHWLPRIPARPPSLTGTPRTSAVSAHSPRSQRSAVTPRVPASTAADRRQMPTSQWHPHRNVLVISSEGSDSEEGEFVPSLTKVGHQRSNSRRLVRPAECGISPRANSDHHHHHHHPHHHRDPRAAAPIATPTATVRHEADRR